MQDVRAVRVSAGAAVTSSLLFILHRPALHCRHCGNSGGGDAALMSLAGGRASQLPACTYAASLSPAALSTFLAMPTTAIKKQHSYFMS